MITQTEYIKEIEGIAANITCEAVQIVKADNPDIEQDEIKEAAQELINDSLLHETIDGHEWIIYTAYNLDIIQHSQNDEYYKDIYSNEDAGKFLADKGIDSLHSMIAFWVMYADVRDELDNALDVEIDEEN